MEKILFQTELTELATTDIEGLGKVRKGDRGEVYQWIRNDASTALSRYGSCLEKFTSVLADVGKAVLSPDAATGPSTAQITMPLGKPMTGIGATGSSTGCYGWVMRRGRAKVNVYQAATESQTKGGNCALGTSTIPATGAWDKPYTSVVDSTNGGIVNLRCIQLANSVITTGAATAVSAIAYIRCYP